MKLKKNIYLIKLVDNALLRKKTFKTKIRIKNKGVMYTIS